MPDVPLMLLFASIFFILISVVVAVRGFYGDTVFYVATGQAICVLIGSFILFWKVGTTANNKIMKYTAEMMERQQRHSKHQNVEIANYTEEITDNIQTRANSTKM